MGATAEAPPPAAAAPPTRTSSFPGREDCWSENATFTLIDAWGSRYLQLNRGNLRQSHWQEVAAIVNLRHGHDRRSTRTDVQCKNRIDTLKKKYKVERTRVSDSSTGAGAAGAGGAYSGSWPFFHAVDSLIGETFPLKKQSPQVNSTRRRSLPGAKPPAWTVTPVAPRSGTQKRPAPGSVEDSYFRRSLLSFAAAVAAAAESGDSKGRSEKRKRRRESDEGEEEEEQEQEEERELGCRELVMAIERVGEIYERVEAAKRRQMVELEKQRMQFLKDLECQRMQIFMETQVHLLKIKRSKKDSAPDSFS